MSMRSTVLRETYQQGFVPNCGSSEWTHGPGLRIGGDELHALVFVPDGEVAFDLNRAERRAIGVDTVAHHQVVADVDNQQRNRERNAQDG